MGLRSSFKNTLEIKQNTRTAYHDSDLKSHNHFKNLMSPVSINSQWKPGNTL